MSYWIHVFVGIAEAGDALQEEGNNIKVE